MKKKKVIFVFVLVFLLLLFLSYLIIHLFFGKEVVNYNKRKLIDKYKNYEKEFYSSVEELKLETSDINFDVTGPTILIEKYIEDSSSTNGVTIKKVKNNKRYKNTINLIKKLNLKRVAKEHGNVLFLYETPYGKGQYIIYLIDEKKLRWGYDILEFENIKDNWYYVVVD